MLQCLLLITQINLLKTPFLSGLMISQHFININISTRYVCKLFISSDLIVFLPLSKLYINQPKLINLRDHCVCGEMYQETFYKNSGFIKNCEGSEFFILLQDNKLACHSFISVNIRPKTPGSKTNISSFLNDSGRQNIIFAWVF